MKCFLHTFNVLKNGLFAYLSQLASILFYSTFCNQSFFISPLCREHEDITRLISSIQGRIREASLMYLFNPSPFHFDGSYLDA